MIAVRMRVTGHDQAAIMEALRQCPPGVHGRSTTHGRDWGHYAERTAQFAYGPAGTRRAEQLRQHCAKWEKLEGRERQVVDLDRSRGVVSHEKPVREQEHPKPHERKGRLISR
ncbi:hypothetical protein [Caballeronia grimmiae]|uniref:hypothetical protein n=1 Tax=Caballeronia grimmiae TaxID=1071679 RepID=UPI0038B8D92F